MIRFRCREDERRFLALISEIYRLVGANMPPEHARVVMRNLGKVQDLLLLEGVRQGVAAAAISNASIDDEGRSMSDLRAFQLHARVYGAHDTPLGDVEHEWVDRLGMPDEISSNPWLDQNPMEFAPDTEQAALAEEASRRAKAEWEEWEPKRIDVGPNELPGEPFDMDAFLASNEESQESPEMLDRIRDCLLDMGKQGVRPRDWQDMVLRLHMQLHIDAGAIDMQLGTAMGRNVLAQTGFHDMSPGPFGTNLSEIQSIASPAAPSVGSQREDETDT